MLLCMPPDVVFRQLLILAAADADYEITLIDKMLIRCLFCCFISLRSGAYKRALMLLMPRKSVDSAP